MTALVRLLGRRRWLSSAGPQSPASTLGAWRTQTACNSWQKAVDLLQNTETELTRTEEEEDGEAPTDTKIDESTRISHERLKANPIAGGTPLARFSALSAVRLLSPVLCKADSTTRWQELAASMGVVEAARLVGMATDSPNVDFLFTQTTRQLVRDSNTAPAAVIASLTETWAVHDIVTVMLAAVPCFVESASADPRALGRFLGSCARNRDKRDGDEMIFQFLVRWAEQQQRPMSEVAVAQFAGSAIAAHADGWEDEDVGWAVRYFLVDFDLWWGKLPTALAFDRTSESLIVLNSHLIAEVILGLNKANTPSLVEHLLNVTTDTWGTGFQEKSITLVHKLLKPHETFLSRILG